MMVAIIVVFTSCFFVDILFTVTSSRILIRPKAFVLGSNPSDVILSPTPASHSVAVLDSRKPRQMLISEHCGSAWLMSMLQCK